MAPTATAVKSPRRRRYVEKPDVRAMMLDAAEALIREEGYGAATARRVADRVGMKHQAIFYYFGSQDELLVEVFRRAANVQRERLAIALNSESPLRAMSEFHRDRDVTKFLLEFMALANHNEAIRNEIAKNAEEVRQMEVEAIERYTNQLGIEPRLSPLVVSILTSASARLLVQEENLGITLGHEEFRHLDDASFRAFELASDVDAGVAPIVEAFSKQDTEPSD